MSELLDSGARREFSTGAVRDISEDKGRCDLLPLDIIAELVNSDGKTSDVLVFIDSYVRTGKVYYLRFAIKAFVDTEYRSMSTALLELSKHYADGAKKYSERNWEKGMDLHCFIDSGVRHYFKHLRGDKDEPHDRAFIWNMVGAMWTHKHKPELIDLPFKEAEAEAPKEDAPDVIEEKIEAMYREAKNHKREMCFG